jgi:hypothetical protein
MESALWVMAREYLWHAINSKVATSREKTAFHSMDAWRDNTIYYVKVAMAARFKDAARGELIGRDFIGFREFLGKWFLALMKEHATMNDMYKAVLAVGFEYLSDPPEIWLLEWAGFFEHCRSLPQ